MSKRKLLIFVSLILAVAVFAWTSGDALAQAKGEGEKAREEVLKDIAPTKGEREKARDEILKKDREEVLKDIAPKGKVTRDDQAKYLGKMTPTEQKAAAKRARHLGLKPGVAGHAAQAPAPGGTR
jgi:hypothetical protein